MGDPEFGSGIISTLGLNPNFGSASNSKRDVFFQGDCDQGCLELARLLGWDKELKEMIAQGNQAIEAKKTK